MNKETINLKMKGVINRRQRLHDCDRVYEMSFTFMSAD